VYQIAASAINANTTTAPTIGPAIHVFEDFLSVGVLLKDVAVGDNVDDGAGDAVELAPVLVAVCVAVSDGCHRIKMALALMPSAVLILDVVPAFVNVHSWVGSVLVEVHRFAEYQTMPFSVCAL
jgi:hypothetical protein